MSEIVTLANILASQASIQWFEAVAVVREVADRLMNVASERAIPELHQVRLSPEGHLEIVGVIPTDEPVRRMGQLLQALVAQADVPVQLRLVISQATSPAPPYSSIREYSEALGFFERPERSTVLNQFAGRATAAVAANTSDRAPTLDSLAPLPEKQEQDESEKKKHSPIASQDRSRWPAFAFVAALILAVGSGGFWYARSRGLAPQNRGDVSALAEKASEAMGVAIVAGASKVTETLGLGRIVPGKEATSPAAAPPAPPPPPTGVRASQPRRRETAPPAEPGPPVMAFDLDPAPPAPAATGLPAPAIVSAPAAADTGRPDEETIYSVNSVAVTPPIGVRPKLARQLPPHFDADRLGRIELIIGMDGTVESAKLLGPPRTVNDGLFLSVAKAWTFLPAMKDGAPVRYRKTIWVASP